ncbi:Rpn family recombination-promoting nuclease/putative transposase [Rickettsiella massiliensis]|uniref:Rpn family recombination-promoting nuclease/putative transposase n=1 Tax=Rickettsiella massiliensis TaxID=676517 RepID=UPI0038B61D5C
MFQTKPKRKKVAIDFLKAHLEKEIYKALNINTLQLTEKSFIVPELREIHSDIIYKCQINQKPGYLFFLVEHESTAKDELMAFRLLHYCCTTLFPLVMNISNKAIKNCLLFCRFVFIMEKYHPIPIRLTFTITLRTRNLPVR